MELYFDEFIELDFDELCKFINQDGIIKFNNMEKDLKKEISEAMKKIKEIGDENNIMIAKKLVRYYSILYNIEYLIISFINNYSKNDKYGIKLIHRYLENFVYTSKRSIAGVMKAFANDKKLSPFYKNLMFTHLYTPEELLNIKRKELIIERKKIEKEIKLEELNKLLNGIKLEELNKEIDEI